LGVGRLHGRAVSTQYITAQNELNEIGMMRRFRTSYGA
jgi:hypothetical protein